MNPGLALSLLRGAMAGNRARLALTVGCIALGVALAVAVHTIHSSALAEIDHAARTLSGTADLEVRGSRNGFDEALFATLARLPEVAVASPVVELDAPVASAGASLRVMGIDAFRASRLQPGFVAGARDASLANAGSLMDARLAWLTPAALARFAKKPGDTLRLVSGTTFVELRVAGALPQLEGAGELAVIDIATAQEQFGRLGKLSRIDLRLKPGIDAAAFRESLAALLPAGVVASAPASVSGQIAALTRAYRVNLNALALVALATGLFLVFATLALQAARRRQEFALLRALGVTRGGLASLLVLEGALVGAAGAAVGTVLGLLAVVAMLRGFGPDLGGGFFRSDSGFTADALALSAIALLGITSAMAGAGLVARSVNRLDVAQALRERAQDLPGGARHQAPWALGIAVLGAACLALPAIAGLPLGGYAAIAAWLAAAVLLVGPLCRALLSRLPLQGHAIAELAAAQVRELPGHLAAAVAGVVVSVSLCAAMAIMVFSFRLSLDTWLQGVIGADLYARASSTGDTGYFSAAEQLAIAALPGVARSEPMRYDRLMMASRAGEPDAPPLTLIARPLDDRSLAGFQARPARRPAKGERPVVWISQAAVDLQAWRPGMVVALPIDGRKVDVEIGGVFRDYARTWGAVLMDLEDYRRLTGDLRAHDIAIHVARGVDVARLTASIRAVLPTDSGIVFEEARAIHERSLAIFDRTFATTYALEIAALAIALAGVTSSFAALAWSRRREFGVLRHLGLTRAEVSRLLVLEGSAAGVLGSMIGLGVGAVISLVLVHVVNRQSFHWDMEVQWPWGTLAGLAASIVLLCALGARFSGAAAVREDAIHAVKDDA